MILFINEQMLVRGYGKGLMLVRDFCVQLLAHSRDYRIRRQSEFRTGNRLRRAPGEY